MDSRSRGAVNPWIVTTIFLAIALIFTGAATGWALVHYNQEKNTVDTQVEAAVASAKKEQGTTDANNYQAQEKLPYRTFAGPSDYGSLSFNYPKTWSTYVAQDETTTTGLYQAYLNPISVPPITVQNQQYALSVTIQQEDYNTAVQNYSQQVQQGQLTSTAIKVNGEDAIELKGQFSQNLSGTAVLFKIRNTTVTIQTNTGSTFSSDFNSIIASVKFNS